MDLSALEAVPMPGQNQELRTAAVRSVFHAMESIGAIVFFEKSLTSSDAAGSGRVVIPKAIAEQYFPRLEQQNGLPVRAVDTRGREYTFKFRFWINNQSRMYLLEGAGELHRAFEMIVGDVMVFAQKPDGTLIMAGRPATKNDVIKKAPIKRASSKAEGGGPGKREPKPKRSAGEGGRGAGGAKKRTKATGSFGGMVGGGESEPAVDGIFRAVPNGLGSLAVGISANRSGRWVVSLNLAGELYQAQFDTQEDAQEAFNAAGSGQTVPVPASA